VSRIFGIQLKQALNQINTAPRALIFLGTNPGTYLYTGNVTVEHDGNTWSAVGAEIGSLTIEANGTQTITFNLYNSKFNTVSAVALAPKGLDGVECKIYYYEKGNTFLYFDGFITDIGEIDSKDQRVPLTAQTIDYDSITMPRLILGPPVLNHIPPEGSVINWDGQEIILDSGVDSA